MANAGLLQKHARSWPVIAGAASLIALAITSGYNPLGGHHSKLLDTEQTVRRLSSALEEHTLTTFDAVDGVLKATIRHLRLLRRLGADELTSVRGVLAAGADSLRQIHALILYDAEGHPINAGLMPVPPTLSVADRAFFSRHRETSDVGVLISMPRKSLISGYTVLTLSRRLEDENGSFAGVLAPDIPIETLTGTFYRALNVGPKGSADLVRIDGTLLAREPVLPEQRGAPVVAKPASLMRLDEAPAGIYRGTTHVENVERITGYRLLRTFPAIVSVSIAVEDALAEWYEQVREFAAFWSLCAVVVSILTFLSVRDASRRAVAEIEARKAKTMLSDAIESLDAGMVVFDSDDRFVMMNRRMAEISPAAYVALAVPGTSYHVMVRTLAESGEITAASGREDEWVRDRLRGHRLPGGWREERRVGKSWQQVSERVTNSGGVALLISDVTSIKETIAALQASEDRFQRMAANIPGYVFQRNVAADGTVTFPFISEGARDFYGCDPEDLMLDPSIIKRAIHPDDFQRVNQRVRAAIATLAPWQADYRLVAKDGSVRWVASQARAIRLGDGGVLWDGVVVDITARKEAEAQLTDAKLRAERATRAKSSFLASMSHELRTPLNAILGFSELMATTALAPKLAHKAAEYAADIHNAGSHPLQLINDLLDLSKAEAGKMELSESEVRIDGIVERVVHLVGGHARDGGVAITSTVSSAMPLVRADERKLLQMLLNLVANAVKFTPAGGKVTVSAGISAEGDLRMTVADTGVGIAAKNLPRVLIPFAQVDNDITRATNGTGLGLPIAKQFAELHGGSLTLESVQGRGTTVSVHLPGERLIDWKPELRRAG